MTQARDTTSLSLSIRLSPFPHPFLNSTSPYPQPKNQPTTGTGPLCSLSYPVLAADDEEDTEDEDGKMSQFTEMDRKHMRRALELAAQALGGWVGEWEMVGWIDGKL